MRIRTTRQLVSSIDDILDTIAPSLDWVSWIMYMLESLEFHPMRGANSGQAIPIDPDLVRLKAYIDARLENGEW